MSTWTKEEKHAIVRYNFPRGLSVNQCFEEMSSVIGEDCPCQTSIFRRYKKFKRGEFSLKDDLRAGRPAEAVTTPENIVAVEKLLEESRRITYRQIEELLHISAPAVHHIFHDNLKVRKVYILWVPHALTAQQKSERVKWCKKILKRFEA